MHSLFLLAAVAAATPAPAAPMSNTDRIAAVCRESVGFDVGSRDITAGVDLTNKGEDYLEALMLVRRNRAKAKYQMANLPKEQDDAVNTLCDFYLKGSSDSINGVATMFKAQREPAPVAGGTPAR